MVRSILENLVEIHVPLLATKHEALPDIRDLQVNLKVQGANKLLNIVLNIVQQKKFISYRREAPMP